MRQTHCLSAVLILVVAREERRNRDPVGEIVVGDRGPIPRDAAY